MLELADIRSGYGRAEVLHGVSLTVPAGRITCLMGRNGAGKTTLLRTIMRILPLASGRVALDGEDISALPAHEVPRRRVGLVPQGRRLFADLTVAENLEVGLMTCGESRRTREEVLDLFPRLRERLGQRAGTLSGGEQQMLATARALCLRPRVLLLDEPTEGLQPSMVAAIRDVVVHAARAGVAVLLVEQRIATVLEIADSVAFLANGELREVRSIAELKADRSPFHTHLGV